MADHGFERLHFQNTIRKRKMEVFNEAIKFAFFSWFVLACVCLFVSWSWGTQKDILYCLIFESLRGFSPVCCDSFSRSPR